MWEEDIRGSVAHARMLAAQGIITPEDAEEIVSGLFGIREEIKAGEFEWDIADEDVHMAIERVLTERIGPAGARLHTGRSRNDQVATDTRLYVKKRARDIAYRISGVREELLAAAEEHAHCVVPGYTHLQRAQPVLLSHHLLAYGWMLSRDFTRMRHAFEAADACPLGAAALAGTTYPIDRDMVAGQLGFSAVSENSMDAVSDRDFLVDLVYACAMCQTHLSRLAEELILWSSEEFGFVVMDDAYSTGSSIMPQKKNPDFAELVRGKTGSVIGSLVALLVTLKGLPLAYNKDMQEDKRVAFDAIDTLADCLQVVQGMLGSLSFNTARMREAADSGFMAATDLADYLVGKGMPFREAHEVVGKMVLELEKSGRSLHDLSAEGFAGFSCEFDPDVSEITDVDRQVGRRGSAGGTGHDPVRKQIAQMRTSIAGDEAWLEATQDPE